ncbi:unnamed protein product [Adineta steineri]|uniref:Uncharacterized protein n=1 Tax=Adineta steineri TaxID=433720 RepID=A0A814P9C8_9BILA|nr:unnamed protein product [Adineta steineri]CAF3484847.1 unnamed protein product [Adineta steineri]
MSEQIPYCEHCLQRYTILRRRKQCNLCGQTFCSKCITKSVTSTSSNNSRTCTTCLVIINENTTRDQLTFIRIKDLRAYLIHSKVVPVNRLESCREKQDLINLIIAKKQRTPDDSYVFVEYAHRINNNVPPTNIQESATNRTEEIPLPIPVVTTSSDELRPETTTDPLPSPPPPSPPPASSLPKVSLSNRKTLADVSSLESIHNLTVGQLKDILTQNFVSYRGCVEKNELITKLELLYRDKQLQEKEFNPSISTEQSDENLCKICMDATIDCVFLDCGHLCTCVQCGKKLSECPLCRCFIIRVVRVFKS